MDKSSFSKVFDIATDDEFMRVAKEIEIYQLEQNAAYAQFVGQVGSKAHSDLPFWFLPVEAFKYISVNCRPKAEITFTSSGTSGQTTSRHEVADIEMYRRSAITHFEERYGPLSEIRLLALLPSYLERSGSSLVWMVEAFAKHTIAGETFFLNDFDALKKALDTSMALNQKTILIGVSFALLDFADQFPCNYPALQIIETGGMKGRKKELLRQELHDRLKEAFNVSYVGSEYGMTELLSQCYLNDKQRFECPRWMRAFAIDVSDPFKLSTRGGRGILCFVDLANAESCSFIRTSDIGKVFPDGSFTVDGRLDNADIRGCNLLYT